VSKLFIFGFGFCGRELANRQRALGWRVEGTVRPGHERDGCRGFDRTHPLPRSALDGVTHVLASIPPDDQGGDGDSGGDPALAWLKRFGPWPDLTWAGYLSTTGVYGDHQGGWVTEQTELKAGAGRSARRIEAERAWLQSGLPVHVFRLAGIYGSGRSALEQVESGKAHRVIKPGQTFGRIHVADVAQVVAASMANPNPGAIYNVADDEPAAPAEVIGYACEILGVPAPPELTWEQAQQRLSPMALSFYADNKKVDNGRIKRELGVILSYPNFRMGLDALLQERVG